MQVLYESMVVMYLMTMLPPAPKIELDDDKLRVENKRRVYGHALVPSFEGLVLFKEQLASSKHALTVRRSCVVPPPARSGTVGVQALCVPRVVIA